MKIIFEDNENSPISKLLRQIYHDDAIFADGNVYVRNYLEEYEDSVCILDVVPDNSNTIILYDELFEEFGERIIPFPCIEFATIFALFSLGFKIDNDLPSDIINLISGNEYKSYDAKSLERHLKARLNSCVHVCLRNKSKIDNSAYGKFYTGTCECDEHHSKWCTKCTLDEKKDAMKKFVPVFWSRSSLVMLYSNLFKSLGVDKGIENLTEL